METVQNKTVLISIIYKLSSEFLKLKYDDIINKKISVNCNYARQLSAYYLFKFTNTEISDISSFLKCSDQSIYYQVKAIEKKLNDRIKKQRINHFIQYANERCYEK